jgi:hypothetical protein
MFISECLELRISLKQLKFNNNNYFVTKYLIDLKETL